MKNLMESLDDDHPNWLVNAQIAGLLEGHGASEDHENVKAFLTNAGLAPDIANAVHKAIATKRDRLQVVMDEAKELAAQADKRNKFQRRFMVAATVLVVITAVFSTWNTTRTVSSNVARIDSNKELIKSNDQLIEKLEQHRRASNATPE